MDLTYPPSGFLRRRSASRGVSTTTERIAVQRSVELAAVVTAFSPCNPKAFRRGADDAGDFDSDLGIAQLGKGIVGTRVFVQCRCSAISGKVVGTEPDLPQ